MICALPIANRTDISLCLYLFCCRTTKLSSKTIRSAARRSEGKNNWIMESGLMELSYLMRSRSASNRLHRPFWFHIRNSWWVVKYVSSRLRMLSPDRSKGKLPHYALRTCSAKWITFRYLNVSSIFTTIFYFCQYHFKALCWKTFGIAAPITCTTIDMTCRHLSLELCCDRLDWIAINWN